MFKSRTVTISMRFYGAFFAVGLIGAYLVGVTSHHEDIIDQIIGPLTVGWKGGVGNLVAYTLVLGVAVVAGALGVVFTALRDADATAQAEAIELDAVPLTRAPSGTNYWPIITAFSVATILVGLATSSRPLALAAAIVLGASVVMWTVRAWAERATGDDRINLELYRQIAEPMRLPVTALLLVAVVIVGFSRVLLTLPNKHASTAVFGIIGVLILAGCVIIALRPKISRSVITLVLFVLGLAIILGGVVGAARGPRRVEKDDRTSGHQVPEGSGR
jgi:hypothetical protein